MTPYALEFTLPGLPRTLNSRGHWRVGHRAKLEWEKAVSAATAGKRPPKPLKYAALWLTRVSSAPMDHDNLVSGFKPIVDALRKCGVLEDDKWENIGMPEYRWIKGKPKQGCVKVRVEERQSNGD